jgi:hypothetical protein
MPSKGLKIVSYYILENDDKCYKSHRYYIWVVDKGWRICPHSTWCIIAQLLSDVYKLEDENIFLTEEYMLV